MRELKNMKKSDHPDEQTFLDDFQSQNEQRGVRKI